MAEDKPSTPEQQLLKLIEGQKGQAAGPGASKEASQPVKRRSLSVMKWPGALLGALSFWKRKAKKRARVPGRGPVFGLGEVNKVLALSTVALFIYVVFDAVASARNLQHPANFVPPKDLRSNVVKESVPPLEETSYYLQKVSSRDIFKEGRKEEAVVTQAEAPAAPETAEAIQNLALVGISWSKDPDAIIEDKSQQRTYFVKRGQMVGESVKVEAIFKNHVVVTYEDREYELR